MSPPPFRSRQLWPRLPSTKPAAPRTESKAVEYVALQSIPIIAPLLPATPLDWHRAACAGDPHPDAWHPYPSQDFTYARIVCGRCPIRAPCAQFARSTRQSGVWGGRDFDRGRIVRR
ncbi:WhiB family transcriptional regulator [Nocardia sp. NPDC051570]|uniref:WhiB family transcriptional regulator n=1 Tax=Nocardia sp. NPDC051570 TaxID=3364324 RepID=UPI003791E52B